MPLTAPRNKPRFHMSQSISRHLHPSSRARQRKENVLPTLREREREEDQSGDEPVLPSSSTPSSSRHRKKEQRRGRRSAQRRHNHHHHESSSRRSSRRKSRRNCLLFLANVGCLGKLSYEVFYLYREKELQNVRKLSMFPREVFLDEEEYFTPKNGRVVSPLMEETHPSNQTEAEPFPEEDEDCIYMASWQTLSFPTCNIVHETRFEGDNIKKLGKGTNRDVWEVTPPFQDEDKMVLKTLRIDRHDFSPKFYEMHRIDALAMERLTSSPYIVDIYGFCAHSVFNEFVIPVEAVYSKITQVPPLSKLYFAKDAATSLAIAHFSDGQPRATIAHGDISLANFAFSLNWIHFKLHDFNLSRLLKWNAVTNKPCGFRMEARCAKWHSADECNESLLTEKTDVYALGNVLYFMLTSTPPYDYPKRVPYNLMKEQILGGIPPELPQPILNSTDPSIVAIRKAMYQCYTLDVEKRPSSKHLAESLKKTLRHIEFGEKKKEKEKGKVG